MEYISSTYFNLTMYYNILIIFFIKNKKDFFTQPKIFGIVIFKSIKKGFGNDILDFLDQKFFVSYT